MELPQEVEQRIRRGQPTAQHPLQSLILAENTDILDPLPAGCDERDQRLQLLRRREPTPPLRLRQRRLRQLIHREGTQRLHHQWQAGARRDVFAFPQFDHERQNTLSAGACPHARRRWRARWRSRA